MQLRRIAHRLIEFEPDLLERRTLRRIELVARVDRAEFERTHAVQPALHLARQLREFVGRELRRGLHVLGHRHVGHRQLMLGAGFGDLERRRHDEDRLAVLDRSHPAHRETAAVAGAVHVVDDRMLDIAGAQEIGVQRMRGARALELVDVQRRLRGRQRLPQHLPTEDIFGADIAALPAEQIVFQPVQRQQFDQFGDGRAHGWAVWGMRAIIGAGHAAARHTALPGRRV